VKIYISADIEGVTGTTDWDETEKGEPAYAEFREQMTAEVAAACEGALDAGATEIWVKDAHDSARNLIAAKLPQEAKLIRGWAGHPLSMVTGLDETFQAVMMIGYHAPAASDANPLAHTMNRGITHIKINEQLASEFLLHTYAASLNHVPVAFVSGDAGLCRHVQTFNPHIGTCVVKEGVGNSTINIHPTRAIQAIREGAQQALAGDLSRCLIPLPEHFHVEICYRNHANAYRAAFFPGVKAEGTHTVIFDTADYFDVLRTFMFVLR
jgi:D-amino peptidase